MRDVPFDIRYKDKVHLFNCARLFCLPVHICSVFTTFCDHVHVINAHTAFSEEKCGL